MAVKEIFMFTLNLVILMVGILMIASGVFFTVSEVKQLTADTSTLLHIIQTFLIVSGSILSLLAVCGCCGAIIRSRYVLSAYIAIMSFILLIEVAVVIAFYVLHNRRQKEAIDKIKVSMQSYHEDNELSSKWDLLQNTSKCCGIDGPSDWVTYDDLDGNRVPDSCCESHHNNCTVQRAFAKGCLRELGYFTQLEYKLSGVIVGILFLAEILGIWVAYRLLVNPRDAKWDSPP